MDRQDQVAAPGAALGADALTAPHPLSRRSALKCLTAALGIPAGAGACVYLLRQAAQPGSADVAEVFKNDTLSPQLWAEWQRRRWVVEARNYVRLGRNIQCKNCPNDCLLAPDDRGRCRNKVNRDGTLYTLAYANPVSLQLDPIEKKPLYHFLPGTRVFSLATTGCGFRCLNCQNWEISQSAPEKLKIPAGTELVVREPQPLTRDQIMQLSMFPEDVVALTQSLNAPSIACTYSEPTSYYEYAFDIAQAARKRHVRNVWVTCGYINQKPLLDLCPSLDAANVDLKSFSEQTYRKLNSGKLKPVLETIRTMKKQGVWVEVSYLVVPTYSDDIEGLRRMCGWLTDQVGADTPLHFLRFFPKHRLANLPETPTQTMVHARDIARAAGLPFVYLGNVREVADSDTTHCPSCHKPIIEREGMALTRLCLHDGKCAYCSHKIPGVWT